MHFQILPAHFCASLRDFIPAHCICSPATALTFHWNDCSHFTCTAAIVICIPALELQQPHLYCNSAITPLQHRACVPAIAPALRRTMWGYCQHTLCGLPFFCDGGASTSSPIPRKARRAAMGEGAGPCRPDQRQGIPQESKLDNRKNTFCVF